MLAAGLKRIDAAVRREIDAGLIPGAVLLVQHRGRTVHAAALGEQDPSRHQAMRDDAIFRIYSMTKPIVSVALMMLVEEGRLRLRDPLAQHMAEFADLKLGVVWRDSRGRESLRRVALPPTTPSTPTVPLVHDLLRHTAGLTYGIFGTSRVKSAYVSAGVESGRMSNQQFAARLAELPLAYAPGTVWEYSRATDLIGALIERISGQTLGEFLQQRIFEPLRMVDTGFSVPPDKLHRVAQPFANDPQSGEPIRLINVAKPPVFESGGGGLVSTAADYLRFARMVLGGGTLAGKRLLSRKTVELMTSDHLGADLIRASRVPGASNGYLPGPGYGFGLGFAVRIAAGEAGVPGSIGDHHWSGMAGTYFWIDPAEELIAIWLMQAPEQRQACWAMFKNLVYGAF
ncbi:serine hydrolase domain-containing protein [Piscinibacter sakaiensis]|uniref:serine hydrolase domain-containing protein n=1 Tax=Piscinibacter sakaiensis TaxID=1547922 RepID=UPI003AAEE1C6